MAVQIIGPYKDTHSVLVRIGRKAECTAHSKRASTDSMPSPVIFFGIYTSEKPTRSCFWSHPSEHACNIHQSKVTPVLAPKGYPDAHNTDNQTSLKERATLSCHPQPITRQSLAAWPTASSRAASAGSYRSACPWCRRPDSQPAATKTSSVLTLPRRPTG